ncbi:TlpA disulfide reductase family protein [Streptomyces anulatus]|uniref:TlpA disulfide reductase family protein n=1 Tax=Streptomyces anulatus TaxID=1892 RepID=UPI00340C6C3C
MVNAWASWCGPCRAEAPGLSRVHEELRGEGLGVVGDQCGRRRGTCLREGR